MKISIECGILMRMAQRIPCMHIKESLLSQISHLAVAGIRKSQGVLRQ